ncbi:MAG: signal peptide peptidase SppA [Chitinophagaceae bacterium]|uniref:signal peptide peptidase SppA n=1 Tax=unclassified Paraflavitalea TaxID=2798305 RepID=UPI003D32CB94|nr:signal peptide peptidase SppA [Chitinophagaceae bacterium]
MNSFLKIFLATLTAILVVVLIGILFLIGTVSSLGSKPKEPIGVNAVLTIDLAQTFQERVKDDPFGKLESGESYDNPSQFQLVQLIRHAATDPAVKGIYLKAGANGNGFGTSEDIREALQYFKKSGKFIYAYADVITQGAYFIASVSDKVYTNPQGGLDWRGYSMNYFFMKGLLDKMEIEPQIFYAGQFKSATEPFRTNQMTEPNRLQSNVLVNDLYNHFLALVSASRNVDTATLRSLAVNHSIENAADAVKYKLIDGAKYDDEVRAEIKGKVEASTIQSINFVPIGKYLENTSITEVKSKDRIAVIFAEGDIIDGKAQEDAIGGDSYRNLIRKARLDDQVKAIVLRMNSGGGSAMASEVMWRELTLAKKSKPVIVSFGDVAASGGYYSTCTADSIFAQPNTITGSIGVFSIVPNLASFFNNKLGVTFDGVKTAPDADAMATYKPLTPMQKAWLQRSVDSIYQTFLARVAEGRHRSKAEIDSIGQGRVWSGSRAIELGLVDRIGGLNEAIACAARMAKISEYGLRTYPEPTKFFEKLFGSYKEETKLKWMKEEMGAEAFQWYRSAQYLKNSMGKAQAKMAFDVVVE